jgi:hypothetical protein
MIAYASGTPQVLILLAPQVEVGLECRDRLLNDERMRSVWRQVALQARKQIADPKTDFRGRLETVPSILKIATWWRDEGEPPRDPVELALGAVFLSAVTEFATFVPNKPVPRTQEIEAEAARWRLGAALCEEARSSSPGHRGMFDRELAQALERVQVYFVEWANFIDQAKTGPGVIGRSRKESGEGDDARRGQAQRIGQTMISLFKTPLAGTLATLINVARALPDHEQVTVKDVKNWSRSAP